MDADNTGRQRGSIRNKEKMGLLHVEWVKNDK